ncbi:hypothetical protein P3L10_001071 [Capsicum annuum]
MKNKNTGRLFKKSCFGRFLELYKDRSARIHFLMMMIYDLLRRRIKYVGDDKDLEKGGKNKMDEIWINYRAMPVCVGLQEFAIVTGLRCHHPEEPPPYKRSKARKRKERIDGLFDIARRGYKASDLLTDLEDKTIPEQYREKLYLVWFAHSVILARDVNKVIEDLLARAEDFDKFNNYPWGY